MRNRLEKIKNNYLIWQIIVFGVYLIFAFVSNWSLIIGENLMKYDIWAAEYPLQMLMTDALQHGTLPLWNPLMQFGAPHYAMEGTPVWYPITMLIALIGERPESIAICYAIHIAVGGYGMFLLAKQEITSNNKINGFQDLLAAVICGLLYCGSGIYLSNAQHIMIIISIAWVPYIFFFARQYITSLKVVYVMMAGLCAGFIFVGGYPEIFYDTFLYLFIYVMYFESMEKRNRNSILRGISRFIVICMCTVCACAISLLPFLNNMALITRGNGLGQIPMSFPYSVLVSLFIPNTENIISGVEPSMINFYTGIVTILLIPGVFKKKNNHKAIYGGMLLIAFFMCWGTNSFLHSFVYRFFPMYDSFRFPTLNRAFLFMFALLLVAPVLKQLLHMEISDDIIKIAKKIFVSLLLIVIIIGIFVILKDTEVSQKQTTVIQSLFVPIIFMFVYLGILISAKNNSIKKISLNIGIFFTVIAELLTYSLMETPSTIGITTPTAYTYDLGIREHVDGQINNNKIRNKTIDFVGQERSTNGLNSQNIIFNKTFDEEGYLSFVLSSVSEYRQTYNRCIIEQNPVIYFTDNVIGIDERDLNDWRNAPDTPPEQIYVSTEVANRYNKNVKFREEIKEKVSLDLSKTDYGICVEGNLNATENNTGRVRLYVGSTSNEMVVKTYFYQDEAINSVYLGAYTIREDDEGRYIDIYFPSIQEKYTKLVCEVPNGEEIVSGELVVTSKGTKDSNTETTHFDFNNIGIRVEAPDDGYVTILQAWHKGWKLYVDGEKKEISLVDGCFMGVPVSQGIHNIELKFRPTEFYIGCCITIIYLAILVINIVLYACKNGEKNNENN